MRTTLILADSVAREAKATAARQGVTFSEWVNQALQAKLQSTQGSTPAAPFRMVTFRGLPHAGADVQTLAALRDEHA